MDKFLDALVDVLLFIPRHVYDLVVTLLLDFLNWMPVPLTAQDVTAALNGVGGDILFFLTMFEFGYGLSVVFGAYAARFLLRRIPGIG